MMDNFFSIGLWTQPYTEGTVAQDWTIFSTVWMVTYAPVVGLFTAKISKGRTVRELLVVLFLGSTFGRFLIYGIYGIYGGIMMGYQLDGTLDAVSIMEAGSPEVAMVSVLDTLPMGVMVLLVYCVFTTIFTSTSLAGSSFTLAATASRKLDPEDEPGVNHSVYWAILQTLVGSGLIIIGGLSTMKAFAIMAGALMLIPVSLVILAWFKMAFSENYVRLKYRDLVEAPEVLQEINKMAEAERKDDDVAGEMKSATA